ncbi:MAG: ABC transporter permease, partial [Sphingobium sp.]
MIGALHRNPVMIGLFVIVTIFILMPLAIATIIGFSASPFLTFPPPGYSLQWFARFLGDPEFIASLVLSLQIAAIVTVLATVIGVLAAYGLDQMQVGALKTLTTALILSPLVFPIIVLALALLLFLSKNSLLGSRVGLVGAHLLIAVPLVTSTVAAALASLNRSVTEAAASLGAGPWSSFGLV